jgi:hypothetical protein
MDGLVKMTATGGTGERAYSAARTGYPILPGAVRLRLDASPRWQHRDASTDGTEGTARDGDDLHGSGLWEGLAAVVSGQHTEADASLRATLAGYL